MLPPPSKEETHSQPRMTVLEGYFRLMAAPNQARRCTNRHHLDAACSNASLDQSPSYDPSFDSFPSNFAAGRNLRPLLIEPLQIGKTEHELSRCV